MNFMNNLISFLKFYTKIINIILLIWYLWQSFNFNKIIDGDVLLFNIYLIMNDHLYGAVQLRMQGSGKVLWENYITLKVNDFSERIEKLLSLHVNSMAANFMMAMKYLVFYALLSILYSATISERQLITSWCHQETPIMYLSNCSGLMGR